MKKPVKLSVAGAPCEKEADWSFEDGELVQRLLSLDLRGTNLTHLEYLRLTGNGLTSLPNFIVNDLPSLKELWLDGNSITSVGFDTNFQKASFVMHLEDNPIRVAGLQFDQRKSELWNTLQNEKHDLMTLSVRVPAEPILNKEEIHLVLITALSFCALRPLLRWDKSCIMGL